MNGHRWVFTLIVATCIAGCGGGSGGGGSGGGSASGNTSVPSQQAGSVSGTVTDLSGAPLQGVQVLLQGQSTATTSSGSSGSYTFTNLGPGDYFVVPASPGAYFTPASATVTISGQSASANFVRTAQVFPSTQVIAPYASALHAQMMAVFAVDEQTLGNSLAPQGLYSSGVHYSMSSADYLRLIRGFANEYVGYVQLKAQTMPIDHAAVVSILSDYATHDAAYVATYYGGVNWGLAGGALASFEADTRTSVDGVYAPAILGLP